VDDNLFIRDSNGSRQAHIDLQNGDLHGLKLGNQSDIRLKKDIAPFNDGLDIIRKINPVRFRYNGKGYTRDNDECIGVIAQELKEVMPLLVRTFKAPEEPGKEEMEFYTVDERSLHFILINAVKQLEEKIDRLSAK
jgi:hypothetical protein